MIEIDTLMELRKTKHLKKNELAKILGLSRTSFYRVVKGEQQFNSDMRIRAAAAFPEKRDIFLPSNLTDVLVTK